ncbi:MAG: DUF4232 domain-containing protein [Nocardioidaceae bacterium]|nr:DUF4232 domain-containing protein [Nocardioidaceae bacterium]MCL2615175.1 DUF4232 domain-containing protein [Nocardioidaceae bacterium]
MNKTLSTLGAGLVAASALIVSASTGTAKAAATPQCGNADLHASIRHADAAAGHEYFRLVLTNVSGHSCRTGGFGGLSFVGHGNGTQVGAAADREGRARSLTVAPGHRVVSLVTQTDWGVYDKSECRPTHVDGYRVYVPNATRSQFIRSPQTACASTKVHLLSHGAFHRP